jgi:hypothetical protein
MKLKRRYIGNSIGWEIGKGQYFYGVKHRKISRKFSATVILKAIKTEDLSLIHSLLSVLPIP